jgi:hypothetical protein
MQHRVNAGNTHAVADYMRVAQKHGHTVAMFGPSSQWLPDVQFSTDIRAFDRVVYLFESDLYRPKRLQEVALLGTIPKHHRLVFDMDGMYNPVLVVDGYDRNHPSEAQRAEWFEFYEALADRIVKPTLAPPDSARVTPLVFYAYDPALQLDATAAPPKQFDILHVGHNWWRWKEVAEHLIPAFEQIRDQVGEIGFIGLWWDGPPAEGLGAGPEAAFRTELEAFRRLRIKATSAVMYDQVSRAMSTARINIFTQRPVLHHLRHLTLKYFEIFYADTIPLLMLDADHAAAVYGPAARELTLPGRVAEKLLDALRRPDHYRGVVQDVRRHLVAHHSYDQRVEELVAAMRH